MQTTRYEKDDANRLLPLLESIGRELEERTAKLAVLELELVAQGNAPDGDPVVSDLVAQIAAHRKGLRQCRSELEKLGCSVLGTEPLTFRIPVQDDSGRKSLVWQTGTAAALV